MAGSGYSQEQGEDGLCQARLEPHELLGGLQASPLVPAVSPLTTQLSR